MAAKSSILCESCASWLKRFSEVQPRFSFPFPKVKDKVIYFLLITYTKFNFAAGEVPTSETQQVLWPVVEKLGGSKWLQGISGLFSVCRSHAHPSNSTVPRTEDPSQTRDQSDFDAGGCTSLAIEEHPQTSLPSPLLGKGPGGGWGREERAGPSTNMVIQFTAFQSSCLELAWVLGPRKSQWTSQSD